MRHPLHSLPSKLQFLVVLVATMLLVSGTATASQAPTLIPQVYFPHMQFDPSCDAPPLIPLALGSTRLAFISGNAREPHAITLFNPVTNQAEPLINDDLVQALAWSPDATDIAYWTSDGKSNTIKLLRIADRRVTTIASSLEGGYINTLSWSPDGQQIAFSLHRLGTGGEFSSIMVMRRDGTQMRQLSAMDYDFAPAWSPNGQQIAFVSVQNQGSQGYLYVMNQNGGNPTLLTDGLNLLSQIAWSPNGRQIAFRGDGLFIINADGTGKQCLRISASNLDNVESWSPDGRQIAYSATSSPGMRTLRIVNVDGSGYSEFPYAGRSVRWAPR
jgi:Tol biopolymer transport system component